MKENGKVARSIVDQLRNPPSRTADTARQPKSRLTPQSPGKCEAIALAQTGKGGQQSRQEALEANAVRAPLGV